MMFKEVEEQIRPPRVVHVRFPFGRPLGEPGNADQQRVIIEDSLEALVNVNTPGTVVELPYRWRREEYAIIRKARERVATVPSGAGPSI